MKKRTVGLAIAAALLLSAAAFLVSTTTQRPEAATSLTITQTTETDAETSAPQTPVALAQKPAASTTPSSPPTLPLPTDTPTKIPSASPSLTASPTTSPTLTPTLTISTTSTTTPSAVQTSTFSLSPTAAPATPAVTPPPATPQPTPAVQPTSPPLPPPSSNYGQRLIIPAINVNAPIVLVGLDTNGNMAAPAGWFDVGWYRYGPRPGYPGSAALAGHLDTNTGAPAAFWNLDQLAPGDAVIYQTSTGAQLTFIVYETAFYPWDQVPLDRVFARSGEPRVALITCGGQWSRENRNYSHRTIVYAQLQQ